MKRKIIRIDEELCNGCGECVTACAEGALQIIDGKARLVKEQYCDGFGDCIGECPTGALTIEERESDAFDIQATKQHLYRKGGLDAVERFEKAQTVHDTEEPTAPGGGCPGMRMRNAAQSSHAPKPEPVTENFPRQAIVSELRQWPVQLHLVQPGAPFFLNKELVVCSTCAPVASADVHWRFIRGRSLVVACPKLDRTEGYVEKLGRILAEPSIPRVITLRMEVPCCAGLSRIVEDAAELSGRTDLQVEEIIVNLNGDIQSK